MSTTPGPPLPPGDRVGEIRDGYRWTGTQWVYIDQGPYKTPEEIRAEEDKRKLLTVLAVVAGLILAGLLAWWIWSAVDDDDDDEGVDADPTPSASSEAPEDEEIALTCPQPIGSVVVTTDPEDMWSPGDVVGSDVMLHPVAFGAMTFTNTETGEKFTEPAVSLTEADRTGAVECTFTDTVEDEIGEDGEPVNGTVEGTVVVVAR